MAFNPLDTDPLGIGLQARAADRKRAQNAQDQATMSPGEWNNRPIGPASDPQWDGFFQSLYENGVEGMADNSVGVKKGMWQGPQEGSPDQTSGHLASMEALMNTIGAARATGKLKA